MAIQNFTTVNRRIEEERRTKYCGTASLRLTSLRYRDRAHDSATGPKKDSHVDAMKRMFRQEHGCRKEDSRHHVRALVSQQVLEAAAARASIPSGGLMADTLPYPELEFPPDVKIECIEGHDRLAAADKVLQGSKKRWVVDLYLDNLSDDLRILLTDGYDYQRKPDDGEYYVTIRQFQGIHGEENPFFENLWLARLATNENSRKLFDQLSKHKKYSAAFDALLDIPGLFGGFRLSIIHQLLGMKCDEPNLAYLRYIYKWWHGICDGDKEAMRQITRGTVTAFEGKAPGACSADHSVLLSRLRGGKIFENFSTSQREKLWSRVVSASRRCLIPSLLTFFEDRKLLSDAAGCIRKILDVGRRDTIAGSLEEIFSDANQRKDRCVIQLSETTFGSVAGDIDTRLELGIRQLWLAAFRNYKDLPADTQKKGLLALSRTKADEIALHELASLASRLGFESDKLDEILQKSTDRNIAEHALLTARRPGRYVFRDPERSIGKILEAFAAAVPAPANETADEAGDDIRELEQPPQRYGRPNNMDYEYDKTRLFLPQLHDEVNGEMGEMTSTFVRWSVYCAYFGTPPTLGNVLAGENANGDDVEMTGDIESEQPQLGGGNNRPMTMGEGRDASRQVQDVESRLEKLAQDEASQQERLDKINRQIREQNTRLEELRQESLLEQERLDRLKAAVDQEQGRLDDGRRTVGRVPPKDQTELGTEGESDQSVCIVRQPASEPATSGEADAPWQLTPEASGSRGAETQIVSQRTRRRTQFDFQELVAHNPNKEHEAATAAKAGANGSERGRTIRIDFVNVESESGDKFVISDTVQVDPADPSPVERLAKSYRRKNFHLFDKERNPLNPIDCFHKVVEDGSYTIVLQRQPQDGGRLEQVDSGRPKK